MNGLEYLMHPNLEDKIGDKNWKLPFSLISDKFTGFQTCNISIPNGANYYNQIFQFDLNNDYDAVVGIGCIGIDGSNTSFIASNLKNFNVQIEDENSIIFSNANIKVWMQNLLFLNKNIEDYFRPTFIPAKGRRIKFAIDVINNSGYTLNIAFILLLKNRILPPTYKIDFAKTEIIIPFYSGASYTNPIVQKFELNPIPASYSEIIGALIVAKGKNGYSAEELCLADAAIYYKNEIISDFIPTTFYKSYGYFLPKENLFFNTSINKLFYPIYKDNANRLILTLFIKHFTDANNTKILDVIFLIRKKTTENEK